ncbi:MAG: hypothetical protein AAF318_15805 [Pseudomonadota bacterium]
MRVVAALVLSFGLAAESALADDALSVDRWLQCEAEATVLEDVAARWGEANGKEVDAAQRNIAATRAGFQAIVAFVATQGHGPDARPAAVTVLRPKVEAGRAAARAQSAAVEAESGLDIAYFTVSQTVRACVAAAEAAEGDFDRLRAAAKS